MKNREWYVHLFFFFFFSSFFFFLNAFSGFHSLENFIKKSECQYILTSLQKKVATMEKLYTVRKSKRQN